MATVIFSRLDFLLNIFYYIIYSVAIRCRWAHLGSSKWTKQSPPDLHRSNRICTHPNGLYTLGSTVHRFEWTELVGLRWLDTITWVQRWYQAWVPDLKRVQVLTSTLEVGQTHSPRLSWWPMNQLIQTHTCNLVGLDHTHQLIWLCVLSNRVNSSRVPNSCHQ